MADAIVYTEFGGPEVLHVAEIPKRAPDAGEVAVRIEAAGVNPIDWKQRSAFRPTTAIVEPRRAGVDGAGVVTAVGPDVLGFRPGDAVVVWGVLGTYASDLVAPVSNVQPRPRTVSAAEGAALGIPVGTAYQSLRSLDVGPGDVLLIHGGSGAVGQAAIQFAVLWGATVLATTSARRAERVRELGAIPVAYGDGLTERVRAAAPEGVTVALDLVGTDEAVQTSLELVPDRDRIATIVRGPDAGALGIRAFSGGGPLPLSRQELAWRDEAVPVALALMAAGAFSVEVGRSFPLAAAADAQQLVQNGTDGKVTLIP